MLLFSVLTFVRTGCCQSIRQVAPPLRLPTERHSYWLVSSCIAFPGNRLFMSDNIAGEGGRHPWNFGEAGMWLCPLLNRSYCGNLSHIRTRTSQFQNIGAFNIRAMKIMEMVAG